MKKLATLLVAASFILPMTHSVAQAAPSKVKKTFKKRSYSRKTNRLSAKKKAQKPALLSTEGMTPDRFHCEMGKTFTLYRYPGDGNSAILDWAGTRRKMHRVPSKIGAERFETDAKLTYIGVSNLTQLIDFKQGKPVLTECRNAEQNLVQNELDQKKAEEKLAKNQPVQAKKETKKKKGFWPFN